MNILVSALEPSANLHLKEVLKHIDSYKLTGIFDESLGEPLYSQKEFSVMGIFDVIPKIKKAKIAIKEMVEMSRNADIILLIDAPSFNLPLAKAIKQNNPNTKIIYYILPKVWAWKKFRAKLIDKYTDFAISIFPFESSYFKNSIYFGNPIVDEISVLKEKQNSGNKIAFLAGSRRSEIKTLMPIYKELISKIDCQPLLVVPSHFSDEDIEELYGDISSFILYRDIQEAVSTSSFSFVCSGTATLEVAIMGVPFVLVYRANTIEYLIALMFVDLSNVGLANIVLKYENISKIHPEIIQSNLTIDNLLEAYKDYDFSNFFTKLKILRELLKSGTSKEVANLIEKHS
jgi:lipid-A-disaccharide synthase